MSQNLSSVSHFVDLIKNEAMTVTVESVDPWWPSGGMINLRVAGLPKHGPVQKRLIAEVTNYFETVGENGLPLLPIKEVYVTNCDLVVIGDSSRVAMAANA